MLASNFGSARDGKWCRTIDTVVNLTGWYPKVPATGNSWVPAMMELPITLPVLVKSASVFAAGASRWAIFAAAQVPQAGANNGGQVIETRHEPLAMIGQLDKAVAL